MLEFDHLRICVRGKVILRDVSFCVPKGEITVLVGKNGSGKSTLLNAVCSPKGYDGRIVLDGRDIKEYAPKERGRKVGMLRQVLPETSLDIRSLVAVGRTPYTGSMGILSQCDRIAIDSAMEMAGVTELANRHVDSLSGGERQRAYLGMLLAQDPELVLFDEPATYLDFGAAEEMYACMKRLVAQYGKTVLAVMHDLNAALMFAEKVVILQNGTIGFDGSKDQCLLQCAIEKHFALKRFMIDGHIFFK